MMNIDKLKIGMKFKNYKKICEALEEPTKSSNSKKAQISNWRKYFEFKKEKTSYEIIAIYDKPRATTYLEKVELLLLHMLATSENTNYEIFAPKTTLLQNLNIVNPNYKICDQNKEGLSKYTNIDIDAIYDFFHSVDSSTKYQLEKVLNGLSNKLLISYNTVDMVCTNEQNTYTMDNNKTMQSNITYRRATDEEIEYSLEVRKRILNSLDCESIKHVIGKGIYHTYMQNCTTTFKRERDFNFFYKAYEIVFHKPNINIRLQDLANKYQLNNDQYTVIKEETNITHINSLNKNAEIRSNKAVAYKETFQLDDIIGLWQYTAEEVAKMLHISKYSIDMSLLRSDENYISNMEKLADLLISNNVKDISNVINKVKDSDTNG